MERISSSLEPLGQALKQTYTALNNVNYTDYLQSKTVQTIGVVALAILAAVAAITGLSCLFMAIGPVCSSVIFACTLSALVLACMPTIIKSATKQYATKATQTPAPKIKHIGVTAKPRTNTTGVTAKPLTKSTGINTSANIKHKGTETGERARLGGFQQAHEPHNTDHIDYKEPVQVADPKIAIPLPGLNGWPTPSLWWRVWNSCCNVCNWLYENW